MRWLVSFVLASSVIGVSEVLACRSHIRLRDVRTTEADRVPDLCRDEGIWAYVYADTAFFSVDLHDSIPRDLINTGCSDILGRFLCTAHYPRLDLARHGLRGWEKYAQPCAEVCKTVWRDCRTAVRNLNIERPQELNCKRYLPEEGNECLPYLYPPRDQLLLLDVARYNASSVSLPYAAPEKASRTKTIRVRYNETLSWGQMERELFYPIRRNRSHHKMKIDNLKSAEGYSFEVTVFNSFGEGPKTFVSVPAFHGIDDSGTGCENFTVPMCESAIDYGQTAMPNVLGHWSRDDATLAVQSYLPLVELNCSAYIQTFLCALHFPKCTSGPGSTQLPCSDLCVPARRGCDETLTLYGLSLPEGFSCKRFPRYEEGNNCYLGGAPLLGNSTDHLCETITFPACLSAVEYDRATMPNSIGHQTVREAEQDIWTLFAIAEAGCSNHLESFVCSLYLPRCTSSTPVLPCRELCEDVKSGCEDSFLEYGYLWPEQLACEDLPSYKDGATCYLGDLKPMPVDETNFNTPQFNQTIGNVANTTLVVKPRRYDTRNLGVPSMFRGWVDVQGQGAANDYCRVVTKSTGDYLLSCSLAGMEGAPTDLNFNSTGPWFEAGHMDTWYMMDANKDGRDDYCRCVGCLPTTHVSCLLAGEGAFTALTLDYDPVPGGCHYNTVNPYFGR